MKKLSLVIMLFVFQCFAISQFSYYWTPKLTGDTITASRLKYNYDSIKNWSKRISDSANANFMHKSWYERHDSTIKYMKLDTSYQNNAYINDSLYARKFYSKYSKIDTLKSDSIYSRIAYNLTGKFDSVYSKKSKILKSKIDTLTIDTAYIAALKTSNITAQKYTIDTIINKKTTADTIYSLKLEGGDLSAVNGSFLYANYSGSLKYKDTTLFSSNSFQCTLQTFSNDTLYDQDVGTGYYSKIQGLYVVELPNIITSTKSTGKITLAYKNLLFDKAAKGQFVNTNIEILDASDHDTTGFYNCRFHIGQSIQDTSHNFILMDNSRIVDSLNSRAYKKQATRGLFPNSAALLVIPSAFIARMW